MNNVNWSPRLMVGAAIVGIVGAAGVFIYEQICAEKRRSMLINEVARLDKQVSSMRTELESLRELQKESYNSSSEKNMELKLQRYPRDPRTIRRLKLRKARRERPPKKAAASGDAIDAAEQSYASDSEYFTDYQSVMGTDGEMDSEEFYDVPTDEDEDDTLRESLRNGHVNELHDEVASETEKVETPAITVKSAT